MSDQPQTTPVGGTPPTVADFFEAGRARLRLELVAGAVNLARVIEEPVVNRPGLALTGFYEHFAWKRLQLIGHSEAAYLRSLDLGTRLERLRTLCEHQAICFVYTNGTRPSPDVADVLERSGAVLLASPLEPRVFASECAFVLGRLTAPTVQLYGTMIEVGGVGVMIEGAPGLGKSETALGLVKRGNALVADDLTCVRKEVGTNVLIASASGATSGFMEIRGIGLLNVRRSFGINAVRGEKRLQLVITFKRLDDIAGEIDRLGQTRQSKTILGVAVPNIVIPVSEGRDLVNLVETAVQQQKILETGYDPVEELSERLRVRADSRAVKQESEQGDRNG